MKLCSFFFLLNVGRDEFVLSRRRASSSTNPVFTPMMTRKKVRVSEGLFIMLLIQDSRLGMYFLNFLLFTQHMKVTLNERLYRILRDTRHDPTD